MEAVMSKKQEKVFKTIIILLVVFLIGESIFFGIRYYNNRKSSTFYTIVSGLVLDKANNYVGVGFSDYRYSKFNKYDKGYEKATIFKIKNGKTVKEVGLLKGYNGRYNDIIETEDGYIAVGKIEMTKKQNEESMSEGVIVKYDKNFKLVWRKNLSILEKTEFKKVKLDGDDIVVVGTSVYSEGYIGNHTTGGAILFKYDKDGKELLRANYGGPYNGIFNDFLIEDNSYVAVGLGASNSGIIIKYDKKGKKLASGSYGKTDKNGINAIDKLGDSYITATTKVINPKDLSHYSAALVKFDKDLKVEDSAKYNNKKINYFNDILVNDNNIYVCGYVGNPSKKKLLSDAVIVKFDNNLYEQKTDILKGNKNDYYSNLYLKDNSIYALGYSNSKLKEYKVNGYDYSTVIKKYNKDLK